ncbi:uncharacterized protein [Dermacentor albipictus]|uniref:uncharacterized protein n=1 Tax=Dermacentor albipictus TaxID=60249 RepID=UPI0038FD0165
MVRMNVNDVSVELKVDTGSQVNLMPVGIYKRMRPSPEMKQSSVVLHSYSGDTIKHLGVIQTEVTLGDRTVPLEFFVVRKGRAILGLQATKRLGLLSRVHSVSQDDCEEIVKEFRHIFTGTGCVNKVYHMVLRDNAEPVIQPVRRVPLALTEPLRGELERMEHAGIITKVTEPTDWFVPGKQLLLADMLSRATTKTMACDLDSNDVEVHAVSTVSSLVSENTWRRLAAETARDEQLRNVLRDLEAGKCLDGLWKRFAGELSHVKGVLLKDCKVVIPASMKRETLERIHQGHLGINKCEARARQPTPLECGASPAELLMGRRLRTTIPDVQGNPSHEVIWRLQTDHSRGSAAHLSPGDTVRIKKGAWDTKAKVLKPAGYPRSYTVVTENGTVLRRNRQHLLLTREPFRRSVQEDDDDDFERNSGQRNGSAPSYTECTAPSIPSEPCAPISVSSTPAPRRSLRQRRPPQRLAYDENFARVP